MRKSGEKLRHVSCESEGIMWKNYSLVKINKAFSIKKSVKIKSREYKQIMEKNRENK